MKVKVTQSCPSLCDPMDYTVHGILQARILECVAFPFSRRSSQPRDWAQVSCIAGGSFTSWTTGKPKNIGVGRLSFLQWIFPTLESNWGLLHCRQILYQLSYLRSILLKQRCSYRLPTSHCLWVVEGSERSLLRLFFRSTNLLRKAPPLWPIHLPKPPTLYYITLRVSIQHKNLGVHKHS